MAALRRRTYLNIINGGFMFIAIRKTIATIMINQMTAIPARRMICLVVKPRRERGRAATDEAACGRTPVPGDADSATESVTGAEPGMAKAGT
jgi:hypothetical protein